LGPNIDSASWGLQLLLSRPHEATFRLGGSLLFSANSSVRGISFEVALGLGAAVAGALVVYLATLKKTALVTSRSLKTIEEEHQQFLAAAEGAMDAFYILDSVRNENGDIEDFRFRYLNPPTEQRLSIARKDLLGTSYRKQMDLIVSDDQFKLYCQVVETGIPFCVEFPVKRPGARIKFLRHQVVKLGDGIAVTSSDLTEFKSVQERFHKVAEFSETIFENAPFSIIATDAEGTITAMNIAAESLTGYRSTEMVNKVSLLMLHDAEELGQRAFHIQAEHGLRLEGFDVVAGPLEGWTGEMNGDGGVREEQWTFIRRDGTRVSVTLATKVLRGSDGKRTGLIGIASDVSTRLPALYNAAPVPNHDSLTGLIGYVFLEDRITQAIKRSKRIATKVAVFTIDLDHFKRINDALGHRVGDEILTVAAARLMEKVRNADTVARVGGDEFIVVVSDQLRVSDVEFCAELFLRAISAPYHVQGHTINVTASIGICLFPDFAGDTEHILRRSESAMYAAKEAGRNRSVLFAPEMLEDASSRISMEGALRQALDNEELFLEYQPQVELPSGKVIGMEALLRWRHPRFGLVSPAHFIPMAEKIGLLPDFGIWAMHRACREAKWIQNQINRRVSLSVNLSPNQFEQKKLLKTIEDSLQESGLAASDLEIEIIENTLMINSTANLKTLQMIREMGVKLSIDDFGTGFCNFNYLLQYQVDRLKIDQSFVRQAANDTNAASVVRTVIAMSHGLSVKVIAEGVETREQLKFLLRRRCDQAQGYFFARPLSPERFVDAVPIIESMSLHEHSGERAIAAPLAGEETGFTASAGRSSMNVN
jgi:diguanylate cyclase (GGDEF)-like protein